MNFFDDLFSFTGLPDMDLDGDHDLTDMIIHQEAIDADINGDSSFDQSADWMDDYDEMNDFDWEDEVEEGLEYGIAPEDYDSYDEFHSALEEMKNNWRNTVEDGSEYGLYPIDFDDEIEYEEAFEAAKLSISAGVPTEAIEKQNYLTSWRKHAKNSVGVRPEDYRYKCEYDYAVSEAYKKRDAAKKESRLELLKDDKVYEYCKVAINYPEKPYLYYFHDGIELNLGDFVIVPYGCENTETLGVVVALGKCLGISLPCSADKIKQVKKTN